jgi:hypothetical protein
MSENFALERYTPPHRCLPEDRDDGVENAVKLLAKQRPEALAESALATENLNVMIRHTTIDSMEEIDRVIRELESIRDLLRNEGGRIGREVGGYASVNHAAATAMKVISESLKQWKERPLQNKAAANWPSRD